MQSNPDKIIISQATPDDVEGITSVGVITWLATYPNPELGITQEDIEDQVKQHQTSERKEAFKQRLATETPNLKVFVAKDKQRVVGFCRAIKEPTLNQLKAIYVLPEYQAQGIGTQLWHEALRFFQENKNNIIVHVATYNTNAIAFYKKHGFKETGKQFFEERFRMKSGSVLPETELFLRQAI